jgi:hypothetical protein
MFHSMASGTDLLLSCLEFRPRAKGIIPFEPNATEVGFGLCDKYTVPRYIIEISNLLEPVL